MFSAIHHPHKDEIKPEKTPFPPASFTEVKPKECKEAEIVGSLVKVGGDVLNPKGCKAFQHVSISEEAEYDYWGPDATVDDGDVAQSFSASCIIVEPELEW